MPRSRLQRIADGMIAAVAQSPASRAWTSHELGGGLELIYSRDFDIRRLALRRVGVAVGAREVEVCQDVFRIPAAALRSSYVKRLPGSHSGRNVETHVTELVWRDLGCLRDPLDPDPSPF